MAEAGDLIKIVICMGSSCFSRGNNRNLEVAQEFLKENGTGIQLELTGALCEEKCSKGPNIRINDRLYSNLDPGSFAELLSHIAGRQ